MRFRHEMLLELRLDHGFTQQALARDLGIDVTTYREYESGRVNHPRKGFEMTRLRRRNILVMMESVLKLKSFWDLIEEGG